MTVRAPHRIALVAVLALLASGIAAGCGGSDEGNGGGDEAATAQSGPPDQPVKIRMGWGIPAEEVKYVMMQYPELAENMGTWYDVDWQQFAGTTLPVQGLATDTLDCATVSGLPVANGIERGADLVFMGEFFEERGPNFSTTWLVRKDSGIDSLADLRGRTISTVIGSSSDFMQDYMIEKESGLVVGEDLKEVEVPFAQMPEALLSGRVDMGLFPQPFFGAAMASGKVKPMFRYNDVINPFVQLLNACRRDFVDENPEAMAKFQEDWQKIANWILEKENRDKVIKATSQATKIPVEAIQGFMLTKDDYFRPANGAISVDALQEEWDFFRERGAIKQDLKVDDHIIDLSVTDSEDGA